MGNQLKQRPCEAYISDMRVKAAEARHYYYPDSVVVCGVAQFEDSQFDTLLNPTVLIEVLSPSTEAFDRGGKFAQYRKIPSLCQYLLVAQDQPYIDCFTRQDNGWVLTETVGIDGVLALASIACSLSLREIYDKVWTLSGFPPVKPLDAGASAQKVFQIAGITLVGG